VRHDDVATGLAGLIYDIACSIRAGQKYPAVIGERRIFCFLFLFFFFFNQLSLAGLGARLIGVNLIDAMNLSADLHRTGSPISPFRRRRFCRLDGSRAIDNPGSGILKLNDLATLVAAFVRSILHSRCVFALASARGCGVSPCCYNEGRRNHGNYR